MTPSLQIIIKKKNTTANTRRFRWRRSNGWGASSFGSSFAVVLISGGGAQGGVGLNYWFALGVSEYFSGSRRERGFLNRRRGNCIGAICESFSLSFSFHLKWQIFPLFLRSSYKGQADRVWRESLVVGEEEISGFIFKIGPILGFLAQPIYISMPSYNFC